MGKKGANSSIRSGQHMFLFFVLLAIIPRSCDSLGLVAAFTGLLTTSSVLVAFEITAQKLFPDALINDGKILHSMALMVLIGAYLGSGLGGWVVARLAPSNPSALAAVVAISLTAAQTVLAGLNKAGAAFHDQAETDALKASYPFAALLAFLPCYVLPTLAGPSPTAPPSVVSAAAASKGGEGRLGREDSDSGGEAGKSGERGGKKHK